jgi:hypothetical protein
MCEYLICLITLLRVNGSNAFSPKGTEDLDASTPYLFVFDFSKESFGPAEALATTAANCFYRKPGKDTIKLM